MKKRDLLDCLLFAGLRLIAVVLLLFGMLALIVQLMESWYRFDPNYLGTFLMDALFRPVLYLLSGTILYRIAPRLAQLMSRGLPDHAP